MFWYQDAQNIGKSIPGTQVNSDWPSVCWQATMSISQRALMLCGWGVKAGMVQLYEVLAITGHV